MSEQEVVRRITKARVQLILKHPFLGALALGLPIVPGESVGCPSMGTNGRKIYYKKEFVESLTDEFLLGIVAHEIVHIILQHVVDWRMAKNKEYPEIFTMAQEYAVNGLVREVFQLDLPKNIYYDKAYSGMYTEEIYAELLKKLKPSKSSSFSMELQKKMVDTHGLGVPGKTENGTPGNGTQGKETLEEFAREMKLLVARAANAARMRGKLPAEMDRLLGEILEAKVLWQSVLAEYISSVARADYTWKHPNRRYLYQGLVYPSLRSEQIEVAVAIDTSGSIGITELTEFWSEVQGIMRSFGSYRIYLMACDARVHVWQVLDNFTEPDLKEILRGGGGTAFEPCFSRLAEEDVTPSAFIYLTDGQGSYPSKPPDYPVLWAIKGGYKSIPFGRLLELK